MSSYHLLRLRTVVDETADAKSLIFDVPAALRDTFTYKPGQFLTLRIPHDKHALPRCYSLASSPYRQESLRVTVKRVMDGRASNWICDQLKAGDDVEVMAPAGVFTPKSLDGDFLLFGGGSGITPVFSILNSVLIAGKGRVCLVYANRDEKSVIFREELKALAAMHPTRLTVIHWLDSVQGVPQVAQLGELARSWRDAQCFICGPGPFMDSAVEALYGLQFPPSQVHVERFISLPEEGDAPDPDAAAAAAASADINLEVQLDGATHHVGCSANESLLDAMLRAGVKAPHSCKAGACASCMCTVVTGRVELLHNEALDKNDLAQGWTLACQARALSPEVSVRFPD